MRVALLPTGRTEWHGLPSALHRLFPEHEFYALPEADVFRSDGPFDGVTSTTLTERHEGSVSARGRDPLDRTRGSGSAR